MNRWGLAIAGITVFAGVALQIILPELGERRVESRLTTGGGTAEVRLGAVPALRLLFSDGERFEVVASDLDLELDQREGVFDRLDGFGAVDVSIADSTAGPFRLDTFRLTRDDDQPYSFSASGETSATDLAEFGIDSFELPGESLLDMLVEPLLGEENLIVPIDLAMELTSDEGRIRVVGGGGTVGGVPAGPLAELITAAIVVQL